MNRGKSLSDLLKLLLRSKMRARVKTPVFRYHSIVQRLRNERLVALYLLREHFVFDLNGVRTDGVYTRSIRRQNVRRIFSNIRVRSTLFDG